ncbi:hypothetical protein G6F36_011641 [Rhizopus arrhizus]|nr:hypothetical protein G6F36_011641 [Rhizopus arrhizus]
MYTVNSIEFNCVTRNTSLRDALHNAHKNWKFKVFERETSLSGGDFVVKIWDPILENLFSETSVILHCPRHPNQSFAKVHAIHCLQMHRRLMMPETISDPLSFLLNIPPARKPRAFNTTLS